MSRNNAVPANRLEHLKDNVKALIDRGHDSVVAIKDKAVDISHRARDGGGAALDKTTSLIKKHPIAAVGIAFGIGYLVMRLVRR